MITLPDPDSRMVSIWKALLELGRLQPTDWTLVGGQMVALYAAEYKQPCPRISLDSDILANIRVVQDALTRMCQVLLGIGYVLDGMSQEQVGHRFRRGDVQIDVLAPDGLGRDTSLVTIPPARTVSVPGGTQALHRTEWVQVTVQDETGRLPRPNLLGAILLKARAVDVDDARQNQLSDLAFLLSLVEDPRSLQKELRGREQSWLRRRSELLDDLHHPAWRSIPSTDDAQSARLALRILAGP